MDVNVSQVCDDILHIEHWLGVECWIECESLDQVSYGSGGQSHGHPHQWMLNG